MRCNICFEAVDLECTSQRGPAAWRLTACCSKVYHRQCMQRWLRREGDDIEPYVGALAQYGHGVLQTACPTCNRGKRPGDAKVTQHTIFAPRAVTSAGPPSEGTASGKRKAAVVAVEQGETSRQQEKRPRRAL